MIEYKEVKRHVFANGANILRAIVEHYESGGIDFADSNHMFMSLIASVAEGKVEGSLDEETCMTKWALTEKYQLELDRAREEMQNVVKGPWHQNESR